MKLSCLPVSLYDDMLGGRKPLEHWVRFAARLGLDGLDFSTMLFQGKEISELDRLSEKVYELGLETCMIVPAPDFTHHDARERWRHIEETRSTIRLAARMGAHSVRVTAGQRHPGIGRQQGVEWAVEGMRQVLPVADALGVTLVYENHSRAAPWQYFDFSQAGDIFLEILDRMADTSLAVNFDTANPLVANEDPIALLEAVKHRVATVHAFDTRTRGVLEPVVVGIGIVPFAEIFHILKAAGFDGWICIEEASRTGVAGFEEAVSFVRRAWKEA